MNLETGSVELRSSLQGGITMLDEFESLGLHRASRRQAVMLVPFSKDPEVSEG